MLIETPKLEFNSPEAFQEFADAVDKINDRELAYLIFAQAVSDVREVLTDAFMGWVINGGDIDNSDGDVISDIGHPFGRGAGDDHLRYDEWREELYGIGLKYTYWLDVGGTVSIWQHIGDDFMDEVIFELIEAAREERN